MPMLLFELELANFVLISISFIFGKPVLYPAYQAHSRKIFFIFLLAHLLVLITAA